MSRLVKVDLERHVDDIHDNPVKHGYASRPGDWPWSSFPRHVRLGQYVSEWGAIEPILPAVRPCEQERWWVRFADPPYQTTAVALAGGLTAFRRSGRSLEKATKRPPGEKLRL